MITYISFIDPFALFIFLAICPFKQYEEVNAIFGAFWNGAKFYGKYLTFRIVFIYQFLVFG